MASPSANFCIFNVAAAGVEKFPVSLTTVLVSVAPSTCQKYALELFNRDSSGIVYSVPEDKSSRMSVSNPASVATLIE